MNCQWAEFTLEICLDRKGSLRRNALSRSRLQKDEGLLVYSVLYEMISHHAATQEGEETRFYVSYSVVNASYTAVCFSNVRTSSH